MLPIYWWSPRYIIAILGSGRDATDLHISATSVPVEILDGVEEGGLCLLGLPGILDLAHIRDGSHCC